ncbi:hypothetical protein ABZ208_11150 [Streptomyces sp. NPDC006208]|uniref:hypothetical protein n=1 Tax=Streptomyces sp. NPDC006208 TaxID=3156734 RepID=UPI0033B8A10C
MTQQITEPQPLAEPQVQSAPAAEPEPAKAARPPRRVLRAVARWTAAVLVFAGAGTGTALGISSLERTDVPGLATENDGRWAYPKLSLPALPAGSPRPFTAANDAEIHHADLRSLLLPAPRGAAEDEQLPGGWTGVEQYLSEYAKDERGELREVLTEYAVRHVAARGWTMPDGTSTRIYLLRFPSVAYAESFKDEGLDVGVTAGVPLAEAAATELDESYDTSAKAPGTSAYVYAEPKPYDARQVRQAYVQAGDTVALIVQARTGGAAAVPFHQTVILQNQLLG